MSDRKSSQELQVRREAGLVPADLSNSISQLQRERDSLRLNKASGPAGTFDDKQDAERYANINNAIMYLESVRDHSLTRASELLLTTEKMQSELMPRRELEAEMLTVSIKSEIAKVARRRYGFLKFSSGMLAGFSTLIALMGNFLDRIDLSDTMTLVFVFIAIAAALGCLILVFRENRINSLADHLTSSKGLNEICLSFYEHSLEENEPAKRFSSEALTAFIKNRYSDSFSPLVNSEAQFEKITSLVLVKLIERKAIHRAENSGLDEWFEYDESFIRYVTSQLNVQQPAS